MKTTIYLTRHGQTEWNLEKRLQGRGNSPLTIEGIRRAQELAKRIQTIPIDCIYTSPIGRATETAQILGGQSEILIENHEGLMEMCFGRYEGRQSEEVMKENAQWDIQKIMQGDITLQAPEGENLAQVRERVSRAMDEIIQKNQGKTILIVTHGITLKAIMHYFKDDECIGQVMGQATLTKVEVDETMKSTILFKNDNSHFENKEQQLGW